MPSATGRAQGQRAGVGTILVGALGCAAAALVLVTTLGALGGASLGSGGAGLSTGEAGRASALAVKEIPSLYLHLYEQAAQRYGLDWAILAGIGKVECDNGRDPAPACTHEGAVNAAGAGGPMQFIASTWAQYGVDADGDGPANRWDPADAIYGAANYLRASGAPANYTQAIYAYNHADWYVREVEQWAERYSSTPVELAVGQAQGADGREGLSGADLGLEQETSTPVRFIPGERAELAAGDGHVALIPTGVPATVQELLVAGDELQDLPYGPGGHPDPLGASEEDCSSSLNYVLYRAGIRPLSEIVQDNPLAQDYVDWGAPGPGRWVTIYASAAPVPHVFIVIAGLRLDTSHDGTDVGPNRYENGPRWRILDQIPTWAHWSVRHPPGL
jgi:hypothetical protein